MFERTCEEQDLDPDRWVPVREYTLLHEAGVAQGILESAGIESLLDNEATVGILTHMSNAIGGVRIRVRPADLEAARALLSTAALEAPPAEGEGDAGAQALERDDDEPMETVVEAMVRRALVASLVGYFLPVVLHLWSLTLLVQVPFQKERLDGRHKRRFVAALALTLLGLGVYVPMIGKWVF